MSNPNSHINSDLTRKTQETSDTQNSDRLFKNLTEVDQPRARKSYTPNRTAGTFSAGGRGSPYGSYINLSSQSSSSLRLTQAHSSQVQSNRNNYSSMSNPGSGHTTPTGCGPGSGYFRVPQISQSHHGHSNPHTFTSRLQHTTSIGHNPSNNVSHSTRRIFPPRIPTSFTPRTNELKDDMNAFQDRMKEIFDHYKRPKRVWTCVFYVLVTCFIGCFGEVLFWVTTWFLFL